MTAETGPASPGPTGPAPAERPWPTKRLLLVFVAVPLLAISAVVAATLNSTVVCACQRPTMAPSPIEGVVLSVDAAGLGQVRGFTLRARDGATWAFVVGSLENPTEFPPAHLAEHQASSQPVRAFYRLEGGAAVVYRLEDAGPGPASPT